MPLNTSKKVVAIGLSLSMMANFSQSINAADLVAIPQNIQAAIPPISQTQLNEFSIKSIKSKVSTILNPAKKGEENKAKVLENDDSGKCGTGVHYTFTASTGELKIYGSGDMADYSEESNRPWNSYRDSIESVTIGNNVTSIGYGAFCECHELNTVKISNSVISIGCGAFYNCHSLKSVNIPNNVISIGNNAFFCCSSLESVTIPNRVEKIGDGAFSYCSSLKLVNIPEGVTSIGNEAFSYCDVMELFEVSENNPKYKAVDGILYSKDGDNLIQCPGGKTGEVKILPGVTSIGDRAFCGYKGLTKVTIPNSVKEIKEEAFRDCSSLETVTIPNSVKKIDSYAFSNCTGLNNVTVPGNLDYVGERAFSDCSSLDNFTYKGTEPPQRHDNDVFSGCKKLKKINVPDNYNGDKFCGYDITKKNPSTKEPSKIKKWFNENVAWLAPAFTIISGIATTIGVVIKYDKIKNFCSSHCSCCSCCNKGEESVNDEIPSVPLI